MLLGSVLGTSRVAEMLFNAVVPQSSGRLLTDSNTRSHHHFTFPSFQSALLPSIGLPPWHTVPLLWRCEPSPVTVVCPILWCEPSPTISREYNTIIGISPQHQGGRKSC